VGDSVVEHKIGMRGYDGGVHNSPFQNGRIKEPFTAPGTYNPFMFMQPRRRRLNLLACFQVIAVPFVIFGGTMYLWGFSVHNNDPKWCYLFVVFNVILAIVLGVKALLIYKRYRKDRWVVPWYLLNDDDTWFLVLAVQVLISCFAGVLVGQYIWEDFSSSYYKLSLLHNYVDIDPIQPGQAYLDAGSVLFKDLSYVDTGKAIGYKDGNVWCVAPIKFTTNATADTDFWAVGKDCCTGFPGSFNCQEDRSDSFAHGGLRAVDDADLAMYRLAVTQAIGEYKPHSDFLIDGRMNTVNPLFFHWVRDPVARINSYWNDAVWTYKAALIAFLIINSIVVCFCAKSFWQSRMWG
jgi:hypothetical protein